MEKPLLVLKPNLVSAILPLFARSFAALLPIGITIMILSLLLKFLGFIGNSAKDLIAIVSAGFLAIAFFHMKYKLMMLHFTRYYFYKTHVISIFKFIKVRRDSLPYTQIANIKVNVSFWDRICRCGKIALNTAGKRNAGLRLYYIKNPHKIEKMLHSLIYEYYADVMERPAK